MTKPTEDELLRKSRYVANWLRDVGRFEGIEAADCLDAQADRIEALSADNARKDEALTNINRRASPDSDRSLEDCGDELYWVACEARKALAAIKEPNND